MVGFSTTDLVSGSHLDQSSLARFTTIGPVVLDFVEITSSDTIPNPGDQIRVRLNLKNEGLSATALDITTPLELISLDSNATIKASGSLDPSYGDIAPGESSAGSKSYNINFFDTCQTDKEFIFMVNIYSGEYSYWSATFSLYVYPTGILEISTTIPTEFVLHQNYPNPFNPSTTIKFDLPRTSEVSLKIFNILGEEVATLVSENLSAGSYSYEWDGLNLPSGLYLYRLEAEKFVESKKMILMK
jgi:hypothetical protein